MPINTIKKAFDALGKNQSFEKAREASNFIIENGTLSELEKASQYCFVINDFQVRQKILNIIISLYTTIEQIDKFREQYTPGIINYLALKAVLNQREVDIYTEKVSKITDFKDIMKSLAEIRNNIRRQVLLERGYEIFSNVKDGGALYYEVSDRNYEKKLVTKMISIAKNGDDTSYIRSCYNLHLYEGLPELLFQKEIDLDL